MKEDFWFTRNLQHLAFLASEVGFDLFVSNRADDCDELKDVESAISQLEVAIGNYYKVKNASIA